MLFKDFDDQRNRIFEDLRKVREQTSNAQNSSFLVSFSCTHGMGIGTKRGAMATPRRAAPASFFSLRMASVEANSIIRAVMAKNIRILFVVRFARSRRNPDGMRITLKGL